MLDIALCYTKGLFTRNKYELTNHTKEVLGVTVSRIRCIKAFGTVEVGDFGGWVEKESNLSQEGGCWIYSDATALGDSRVMSNATLCGSAVIHGFATISENARVSGNATVSDSAMVYGNAVVREKARISGGARVYGCALVSGSSLVSHRANIAGNAKVRGEGEVVTKTVITINSSHYPVTITDTHMTIGCQNHTKEYWLNASMYTVKQMDSESPKYIEKLWLKYKPLIMELAKE